MKMPIAVPGLRIIPELGAQIERCYTSLPPHAPWLARTF
jgi:hypothetical protein